MFSFDFDVEPGADDVELQPSVDDWDYTVIPDEVEDMGLSPSTGGFWHEVPSHCPPLLGHGLIRPFERNQTGDFASSCGELLVRSCVGQVLGTHCRNDVLEGELPWRTEFGSLLYLIRHRRNDAVTMALARLYTSDALARWESRVRLQSVNITTESAPGSRDGETVMSIEIGYTLIHSQDSANQVYQTVAVR